MYMNTGKNGKTCISAPIPVGELEDWFVQNGGNYENSGKMLENSIRNQTSTYLSVTVLLTLSNLEIQATKVEV